MTQCCDTQAKHCYRKHWAGKRVSLVESYSGWTITVTAPAFKSAEEVQETIDELKEAVERMWAEDRRRKQCSP